MPEEKAILNKLSETTQIVQTHISITLKSCFAQR